MHPTLLLTSFDVWLPHHRSNSSDDLLAEILSRGMDLQRVYLRRKLPVDFQLAPAQVLAAIAQHRPRMVVCCGMAESRQVLTVERQATCDGLTLYTRLDLQQLTANLCQTEISEDAGNFVCNRLYFEVLNSVKSADFSEMQCIFVHVPILTPINTEAIVSDFLMLIQRLRQPVHA